MGGRSPLLGVLVATGSLALTTAVLYPLSEVAPPVSLAVFLIAAVVASTLSELARVRAGEAEDRRREADLAAEPARLLLGSPEPRSALGPAAKRIADALRVDSAAVVLERVEGDERSVSHDLRSPLTTVVAAGDALASPNLPTDDRLELADTIVHESRRLARLVDQSLDLSRLQAGAAEPRQDWISLPLAEQERIFTPFDRGSGAAGQGSGLGLAIVGGLLEANA